MHYFDIILLSNAIWAFEPKVTRRVTTNNFLVFSALAVQVVRVRVYVHTVSEYDVDFYGRPLPAHARLQNIIHGQNGDSDIRHTRMV